VLLKQNGQVIDQQTLRYGLRDIQVKTDGVYLNGKYLKLQGVNCHQDHAGVGSALPDYLQYYRIGLLREMGVNAYRASHNPPTPELLDACDSLGMLVMDENRLLNSGREHLDQVERLIRRDRSRTCVFMWCIGNEEFGIQQTDYGKRIAQTLLNKQRQLDPTRTCTYASDLPNVYWGVNEVIPVRGFNYREFAVADYHRDHPEQPIIGTEMGSTVSTRGFMLSTVCAAICPIRIFMPPGGRVVPKPGGRWLPKMITGWGASSGPDSITGESRRPFPGPM
jgi:beta-galactosidase